MVKTCYLKCSNAKCVIVFAKIYQIIHPCKIQIEFEFYKDEILQFWKIFTYECLNINYCNTFFSLVFISS